MKKVLYLFAIIILLTSCLDDDDNTSKAEITYFATCEEITLHDENDTKYKNFVLESLDDIKLTGEKSIFTQKATVNNGNMGAAVYECNNLAIEKYGKIITSYDLDHIKQIVFDKHKVDLGINSITDVTLDEFTVTLALRTSYTINSDTIKTYKKTFR